MNKVILEAENVWKSFYKTDVLKGVSFSVREGEMFFLLGPSGCGKTTVLRILSGFCQPEKGKIFLGGKDITNLPANKRNIGMVFQNYALWPHMNVWENVVYGLKIRKLPVEDIRERAEKILKITQLLSHRDKFPSQLSGGQQQRVALSRALVTEPGVLLMDEPLSNLDAKLREQMREEIKRIKREVGITVVYVTHDQKEALALGDRIAVIDNGKIVQAGTPAELYFTPGNRFTADFIGRINILEARVISRTGQFLEVETSEGVIYISGKKQFGQGEEIEIGFRPESAELNGKGPNTIRGEIAEIEYAGETVRLGIKTPNKNSLTVNVLAGRGRELKKGEAVMFSVSPGNILTFEK